MTRGSEAGRTRSLHDRALGLLSVRARSRRELEGRLVEAGFDRAEVSDEVDRLAAVGLIDDDAFARALIDHQAGKRHAGVRALKRALITRGLSSETAERMIAALPDDDAARAEALAAEKVGRVRGLPTDKAYARLLGLLLRRGHSPDVARAAARRALEIDAGTGSA